MQGPIVEYIDSAGITKFMAHHKVSKSEVARHIRMERSDLSRILDGKRPWPRERFAEWQQLCDLINIPVDLFARIGSGPCSVCGRPPVPRLRSAA